MVARCLAQAGETHYASQLYQNIPYMSKQIAGIGISEHETLKKQWEVACAEASRLCPEVLTGPEDLTVPPD